MFVEHCLELLLPRTEWFVPGQMFSNYFFSQEKLLLWLLKSDFISILVSSLWCKSTSIQFGSWIKVVLEEFSWHKSWFRRFWLRTSEYLKDVQLQESRFHLIFHKTDFEHRFRGGESSEIKQKLTDCLNNGCLNLCFDVLKLVRYPYQYLNGTKKGRLQIDTTFRNDLIFSSKLE